MILPLVQFVRSYLDPEGSKESEGAEADPEGADNE